MDDFNDGGKDLPNVRVFDMGNNKLYLKRLDPYGFWHLSLDKGALPEQFRGAYTSPDQAEQAVEVYLAQRGKEVKPVAA